MIILEQATLVSKLTPAMLELAMMTSESTRILFGDIRIDVNDTDVKTDHGDVGVEQDPFW